MAVVINIAQSDIDYAKNFLTQYLSDLMPQADFSEGGALQDLVIKANSYVFAFLKSELTKVETLRSLKQLELLPDDEEKSQAIDDIMSNFLVNRGLGTKAQVKVTIILSQKVDVFIGTGTRFNKDDVHYFYPVINYYFPKEELIEVVGPTGSVTYTIDIYLQAENVGSDYDVAPGTFLTWDIFNAYILSVRNYDAGYRGNAVETDNTYVSRANDAITVRNLVTPRSIRTVLLEKFKDQGLKGVVTAGYGDPEMLRDIVNTNISFIRFDLVHIGNHQDAYVALNLLEDQTYTGTTANVSYIGEFTYDGALRLPQVPIYKIKSVKDSTTLVDLPYRIVVRNHKYYFTSLQEAFIVINSGVNGQSVVVTYDTVSNFQLIHDYLRDPEDRVILANSLARAKIPIYLELNINYRQVKGQTPFIVADGVQTVLEFFDSIADQAELNVDNLLSALHTKYGTQIIIQTPVLIKGTVSYSDGTTQAFYSENILSVPEFPNLGITNRICGYFSSERYITFTLIE